MRDVVGTVQPRPCQTARRSVGSAPRRPEPGNEFSTRRLRGHSRTCRLGYRKDRPHRSQRLRARLTNAQGRYPTAALGSAARAPSRPACRPRLAFWAGIWWRPCSRGAPAGAPPPSTALRSAPWAGSGFGSTVFRLSIDAAPSLRDRRRPPRGAQSHPPRSVRFMTVLQLGRRLSGAIPAGHGRRKRL